MNVRQLHAKIVPLQWMKSTTADVFAQMGSLVLLAKEARLHVICKRITCYMKQNSSIISLSSSKGKRFLRLILVSTWKIT